MVDDIASGVARIAEDLGIDRKRSIGEVAKELKVETHVIRFWEENFPQIKPQIGAGKRRYYYNKQLKILRRIKKFLYEEGYTIAGLQKLLSKRKHDGNKEEDLDIILQESQTHELPKVDAEKILNDEFEEDEVDEAPRKEIDLDDFISPNIEIETGLNRQGKSRLIDYANIKIHAIDPNIEKEIIERIGNIRRNLQRFRSIL